MNTELKNRIIKAIKENVEKRIGKEVTMECRTVEKMNQSYEGLVVRPVDETIGVNINLDALYDEYQKGGDIEDIAERAAQVAGDALGNCPGIDMERLMDYNEMKKTLIMQVVGRDSNKDLLKTVPHKELEDMAVVYRFIADIGTNDHGTILVTDRLLDSYGVTKEQLFADAQEYAPKNRPVEITPMSKMLEKMMGPEACSMVGMPAGEDEQIFVATTADQIHGAGILAYDGFFEEASEFLGGSYYVLPSSIHECLLLKDNGFVDKKMLKGMVCEVNATSVAPEEKLTDSVYHYDADTGVFEIAKNRDDETVA